VIEDFPNLDTIVIPDCGDDIPEKFSNLPKVQIRNCPQLKSVEITCYEVQNFSASNCPQIEKLNLENNSLTSLDISELTNLKVLKCDDDFKPKIIWKNELLR
jgi:Leucine-rich repeat (LRR) protein